MKNQKLSNHKKPIKEGSMSNFESVTQFKEQVERYILKHKDNPNAVINDLASGLFFAFSEAFSKDGRPETNGLNMLEKMINKLRVLMKTHENLIPPEQEEFDFEDSNLDSEETEMEEDENEVQNMVDDLNDNTSLDEEEDEELNGIYESKKNTKRKNVILPYKEKKLSIKTSKDGRKYVKIKCPKRWDNNDNITKNLGYKSANLIDEASLEFTGVKCSHLMFDLKKPKEEIWFHRNKKYRMGSSLYEQFRFKGKNKYYTLLCSDSENPNGQTYTIIESKKQ